MAEISNYIVNGSVQRSKIAVDVADGTISGEEIKSICSNQAIRESFIGNNYSKKTDSDSWDDRYLNEVVCAAVAESFNEDYLNYLSDVGAYVRRKKASGIKLRAVIGIVVKVVVLIVLVFIVGVVIWRTHNSGQ